MPGVGEITKELRFGGGLNVTAPPWDIAENELSLCTNFFVDKEGVLVKRPGFFEAATMSGVTNPMFYLGYNNNYNRYIVVERNTASIYSTISNTVTLIAGIPSGVRWGMWIVGTYYIGYSGSAFGGTGTGIRTLTGTGAAPTFGAVIANSPDSTCAAFHKGRIFTNVSGTPGRIAFSDPITPTAPVATWQTTSIIDVDITNKDPVTAIVSIGDLLLIFKLTSTWVMYVQGTSPADWVIRRVHETVGCIRSHGSVPALSVGNECYFVSPKGIFKTNGSSLVDIGKKVWFPEQLPYSYNGSNAMIRLTRLDDYLILTGNIQESGYTGYQYVYTLETGAWSTWNFLSGTFDDFIVDERDEHAVSEYYGTKGNKTYFASKNTVNNYDFYLGTNINTYSDGLSVASTGTGAAYASIFNTKEFNFGVDNYMRIKWLGLHYLARSTGPTFLGIYDRVIGPTISPGYSSGTFLVSNFDYRMANLSQTYKMPAGRRARIFALNGNHNQTSPFEFYRAAIHMNGKVPILSSGVK